MSSQDQYIYLNQLAWAKLSSSPDGCSACQPKQKKFPLRVVGTPLVFVQICPRFFFMYFVNPGGNFEFSAFYPFT